MAVIVKKDMKGLAEKACSFVQHKLQIHYLGIDARPSLWEAV
jgi:hypothetical protein